MVNSFFLVTINISSVIIYCLDYVITKILILSNNDVVYVVNMLQIIANWFLRSLSDPFQTNGNI